MHSIKQTLAQFNFHNHFRFFKYEKYFMHVIIEMSVISKTQ
jgi:hypothetical protein